MTHYKTEQILFRNNMVAISTAIQLVPQEIVNHTFHRYCLLKEILRMPECIHQLSQDIFYHQFNFYGCNSLSQPIYHDKRNMGRSEIW